MQQTHQQQQFTTLLQQNRAIVYQAITTYCRDESAQDDLFQDIAMNAWLSYKNFRGESKFSTWLWKLAHNTAIDRLRRLKKNVILTDNIFWEIADDQYEEYNRTLNTSIVNQLSEPERRTLQMRMEGIPFAQISEETGEPVSRLMVRMHRIKKQLSKSIKQQS